MVGTLAAARKAVDAGVDGLVVEGVEGGGFKNRCGASSLVLLPLGGVRMMRVIRTDTAELIDAGRSPEPDGSALQPVRSLYFDGDMAASIANTGQVAGRIDRVEPVADIIAEMWAGCRDVLTRTAQRVGG